MEDPKINEVVDSMSAVSVDDLMTYEELDALSFEYKRDYGIASGNLDISDFVNNPNALGIFCVFGPGFSEEIANLPIVKRSVISPLEFGS